MLQQVSDIYIDTYDRMMDLKNSNLKATFFSDAITRIPALSWKLLSEILKKCRQSEKPRSYLLVKSLELCAIIFKVAAVDEQSRPEFCRGITSFKVMIEEFIETLPNLPQNGPFSMPKDRLKAVLKCIVSVIRKSKTALSQDKFKECWDGTTISSRLEQFFDQEKFANQKGLKAMSKEINRIL